MYVGGKTGYIFSKQSRLDADQNRYEPGFIWTPEGRGQEEFHGLAGPLANHSSVSLLWKNA